MVRHLLRFHKKGFPEGDDSVSSICPKTLEGTICACDPYWYALEGACVICKTVTKLRCIGCNHKPFYCSKECQTKGWDDGHKAICGFWKVIKIGGRSFYEAKKKIPAGTKLFRKDPLYVQPDRIQQWQYKACPAALDYIPNNINLDPLVTCLSCAGFCAPIEPVTPTNIKYRRCPVCQWPVCDTAKCAEKHKEMPECPLFAKNHLTWEELSTKMEPFGLVGMIRAVSLKKYKPFKWEQLLKLENFPKEEAATDKDFVKQLFGFLKQSLKIDWVPDSEWEKFLFVQSQNRFRCNHRYAWDTRFVTIVYEGPRGTILPHNCCPNAYVMVDELSFVGTVVTHVTVKKGELLTINLDPEYPRTMRPTYARNSFLTSNGYQLCGPSEIQCNLCLNPQTEDGAMLSAVKCSKCAVGHMMPKSVVNNMWIYTCNTKGCAAVSQHSLIQEEEMIMYRIYLSFKGDIPKIQKWLVEIGEKSLHPLNYVCILARFYLAGKTSDLITRAKITTLEHLRKAKQEFLPTFVYILKWMNSFTPGRHYYKAEFSFFETLLNLGGYAVDLHEKTKSLEEVDELVGEALKVLEWCWEIYCEDPMRNLMDLNVREKAQSKFVSLFFQTAEKIYEGEFKPFTNGKMISVLSQTQNVVTEDSRTTNDGNENGDGDQVKFKNLRRLAEMKKAKFWTGTSHLGDHLAPPDDAFTLESRIYSITSGAAEMIIFD